MKRAYVHAKIDRSRNEAFLVEDGRFAAFGSTEEILDRMDPQDETIDLEGAFVVPGFIDSHMHLMNYGYYLSNLQLASCRSIADVEKMVRDRAARNEDHGWIIGRGYNEEMFKEAIEPTRQMLDTWSPEAPVSLTRSCGHIMIANTKALTAAGITEKTAREDVNYSTGRLEEGAISLVKQAWPIPNEEKLASYIRLGAEKAARFGITAVGSDDFLSIVQDWKTVLNVFMKLSYQKKLAVRVNEQCEFRDIHDFTSFLDEGYTTGVGDDYFAIGPLKMILDGSLGGHTAAMTVPYEDMPDTVGLLNYGDEELRTFIQLANRFNMPTIVHAIGDRALDQVLAVYKDEVLPGNPLHHGIVHCQIMRPDQTERVIAMKLNCYFQSLFIDDDAPIVEARVGHQRASGSYPFRSLYEGTCASNGSDAPIEVPDPLRGIQLAVTRQSLSDPSAALSRNECLTVEQAIDSYTVKGAEAFGMADEIGRLEPGYYADFAVLNQDITKCDPTMIAETKVIMTVTGGEETFQ